MNPRTNEKKLDIVLDHDSNISHSLQIKAQIEYAIATGELPSGAQLPSVRELARQLGTSPVTVLQAYRQLGEEGLLYAQQGRGTFVVQDPGIHIQPGAIQRLEGLIDQLIVEAHKIGVDKDQLLHRIAAHLKKFTINRRILKIGVVGLFDEPTQFYTEVLRAKAKDLATFEALTFEGLERDPACRETLQSFDLLITLPHYVLKLKQLLNNQVPVTDLHFIPSEQTRTALAELSPQVSLLGVSRFPEFLPTLETGIARYAPHVRHTRYTVLDDPDLPSMIQQCEVVVYATGADQVRKFLPKTVRQVFEYRHVPDPVFITEHLLPLIRSMSIQGRSPSPKRVMGQKERNISS